MAEVSISGKIVLVDNEDLPIIRSRSWYISAKGYVVSTLNREQKLWLHREVTKAQPGKDCDHRFGNKLDNRKSMLRITDRQGNQRNKRKCSKRTSSRFKGVCWHKKAGKWCAYIGVSRKRTNLGLFLSEIEAAKCYNKAATNTFGEFALLNAIQQQSTDYER